MTMDSTETKSEDLKGRLCDTAPPASVVNLQSVLELNETHFTDHALQAPWSKIVLSSYLLVGSSHGLQATGGCYYRKHVGRLQCEFSERNWLGSSPKKQA